jgi:hypothetical protein
MNHARIVSPFPAGCMRAVASLVPAGNCAGAA